MDDKKRQLANQILSTLDETANKIDELTKSGKLDQKMASEVINNIDSFSDKFQVYAFGPGSLTRHKLKVAEVLQKDSDEKYMDSFDNIQKVIQSDADEKYMHHTGPTFSGKGMGTYDTDDSSQVIHRDEYAVRDLSEYSGKTSKQPSWDKGPAGKSTKQGSEVPKVIGPKEWA